MGLFHAAPNTMYAACPLWRFPLSSPASCILALLSPFLLYLTLPLWRFWTAGQRIAGGAQARYGRRHAASPASAAARAASACVLCETRHGAHRIDGTLFRARDYLVCRIACAAPRSHRRAICIAAARAHP